MNGGPAGLWAVAVADNVQWPGGFQTTCGGSLGNGLVECGWLFGGFRPAFAADVARSSGGLWATVWQVVDDGLLKVRFTSGDGVGGFVAAAAWQNSLGGLRAVALTMDAIF